MRKYKPNEEPPVSFPHCDSSILHAPGLCQYCDKHGDWQELREAWGINFTGETDEGKLPCPADARRGDKHMLWGGNLPWWDDKINVPMPAQEAIDATRASLFSMLEENE